MEQSTEMTTLPSVGAIAPAGAYHSFLTATPGQLAKVADAARLLATGPVCPVSLRHATDKEIQLANCMKVANQAAIWGVDPFALASCSYVVNGKLSFEGKVLAAIVNTRADLEGKLHPEFTYSGDKITCTLTARIRGEKKDRTARMTWDASEDRQPDWDTDPEQKMYYLLVKKWCNRHCPELLMGIGVATESEVTNGSPVDAARPDINRIQQQSARQEAANEDGQHPDPNAGSSQTLQEALASEPTVAGQPSNAIGAEPVDFFTLEKLSAERDLVFRLLGYGPEATDGPRRKAAWKRILEPRGVASANQLTQAQADELLAKLKEKAQEIHKQKNQAGA